MIKSINYRQLSPETIQALTQTSGALRTAFPDHRLKALIDIRASQINGCAFCIDMHLTEARSLGETQQRLDCLSVWRDVAFFEPRERAALALVEAVTKLTDHSLIEAAREEAAQHFTEREVVEIVTAIAIINAWNRISISFGSTPPTRK